MTGQDRDLFPNRSSDLLGHQTKSGLDSKKNSIKLKVDCSSRRRSANARDPGINNQAIRKAGAPDGVLLEPGYCSART
jgi:hypothetical protein